MSRKIALILSSLSGGVGMVRLTLAREFLSLGYKVDIVLANRNSRLLSEVPPECGVYWLNASRPRGIPGEIGKYLLSHHPDGLIAASWPMSVSAILAARVCRRRLRVVVSEHTDFRTSPTITSKDKLLLRTMGRHLYRRANGVVAVSSGVAQGLHAATGLPEERISIIQNPVRNAEDTEVAESDSSLFSWWCSVPHRLLAVGNMVPEKDYDVLLQAMARLCVDHTYKLIILGDGRLKAEVDSRIEELGLKEFVRTPGYKENPFPFYKRASLFVMSSCNEGWPNVMLEAMSCGAPIVSTDCQSGPAEILQGGKLGALVPVGAPIELADAINAETKRSHDSQTSMTRAAEFSAKVVAQRYEKLLFP